MAKKFKFKSKNTTPRYNAVERTISVDGLQIDGIIKNVYNEVGRWNPEKGETYSKVEGVDPNGEQLKLVTYSERVPLMIRNEFIADYEGGIDTDNDKITIESIDETLYSYEHDEETKDKLNQLVKKYEKKSKTTDTYDEEYFQHIFNWPTEHILKERKLGGFVFENNCCDGNTYYYDHSAVYSGGTMDLDKVVSELYYVDDYWQYQPLELDFHGRIVDPTGKLTDRIGEPIIYHGGTDDDCLFFNYVVDLEDTKIVSTDNLVKIGDTINGATVTNLVNYVVDTALVRIASKSARKGEVDRDITLEDFINLGYTEEDYNNTQSWVQLNIANGLAAGMLAIGKGLRSDTIITAVDESRNRIYISETLNNKKIKRIKFVDDLVNKVSKNTLCYATIENGSFDVDQNYEVFRDGNPTGITICARAGKGIINRSAIVGTYFSKNKKEIEYFPVFYSADSNCEKVTFEDELGEYVLATIVWDDDTRTESEFLLVNPKTEEAYRIATIYSSFTYALIDKETLDRFYTGSDEPDYFKIYNDINDFVKSTIGDKKAAAQFDDFCRDDLQLLYSLAYLPFLESATIVESITTVSDALRDACAANIDPIGDPEVDDFTDRINNIVNNSVKNSIFLNDQYFKKLVSDEDSLINRLTSAGKSVINAVPSKTKVDNQPPQIENQDSSNLRWMKKNFRDFPPEMDRVKFFVGDILIARDQDLESVVDYDPATTVNQPKIIIRSKPLWRWNGQNSWSNTKTHTGTCGSFTSTINVNVSFDGEYLNTITTSAGIVTTPPAITCGDGTPPCVCQTGWAAPSPKSADKNIVFGEKKEPWDFSKLSTEQEGYIAATGVDIHPDLRDLDNLDRKSDDEIKAPDPVVYPKTIWAPNINYQIDFNKIFNFRMEEMTESLSESVENFGNPYLDHPVRTKIRKTIKPEDTTIIVESTDGFLSSGYLMIPKYTKKLFTTETGNIENEYTYCGEEIIYYHSKTENTFEECERELFGTTSDFEMTIPAYLIEVGTRYKIQTLGTTNWEEIGAGSNATVGTVFVATKDAFGTGTVKLMGSTPDIIENQNGEIFENPPKIPVTTSYESGFSVSQQWIFKLKED